MRLSKPVLALLVDAAITLVFMLGLATVFLFTADDAFIVFRYAYNLVHNGELVFNLGEKVTALTSPAHGFLTAALLRSFGAEHIETANKVFSALVVWSTWLYSGRRLFQDVWARILFGVIGLLNPFLLLWTAGGLETPYLAACLTLAYVAYRSTETVRAASFSRRVIVFHLLVAGCFLLRHDSVLFLAPLTLAVATKFSRRFSAAHASAAPNRRPLFASWAALVLVGMGWLTFSWIYFDDPLPTSAYVKLGRNATPWASNLACSKDFLLLSVLPAFGVLAVALRWKFGTQRRLAQSAVVTALGLVFLYSLTHSAQHMFFGFRFFAPYTLIGAALVVEALTTLDWGRSQRTRLLQIGSGLALVLQFGLLFHMKQHGVNVTWTGLVHHEHSREYDDVSIDQYHAFISVLKRAAKPIRKHWQHQVATGEHGPRETPRLAVYTGGVPPFLLPEFYVLEQLVSYRHHCRENGFLQGHYVQFLLITSKDWELAETFRRDAQHRNVASVQLVYQEPIYFGHGKFPMTVFYVAPPRALKVPPGINEPCLR